MRYLAIVGLLVSFLFTKAADSTFNWAAWKKSWPLETLSLKNFSPATNNYSIRGVEVMDMRSDTTCLGLFTSKWHTPHKVIAKTPMQVWMSAGLTGNKGGSQLLLVVKDFWINEAMVAVEKEGNTYAGAHGQRLRRFITSGTKLKCNIDVFVKDGEQYKALVRVDTLLMGMRKVEAGDEPMVEDCMNVIGKKIADALYTGRYATRKMSSRETIAENYSRIYQLPVLTDSVLKKGIYFSWDQFKNNQPVEQVFRIQKNKTEPPTLYLQEEPGKEVLTHEVYAVCDGKQLYKIHGGYVFNIYRDRHSIYWVGVEEISSKEKFIPLIVPLPGVNVYSSESFGSSVKVYLSPYLLNLETGEQY